MRRRIYVHLWLKTDAGWRGIYTNMFARFR